MNNIVGKKEVCDPTVVVVEKKEVGNLQGMQMPLREKYSG